MFIYKCLFKQTPWWQAPYFISISPGSLMKPAKYLLNWWMHISIDKKNHIHVNRENLFSSNIIDTHAKLLSHVWLFVTPWTVAHQAPLSMEFSWQGYWSRFPLEGDLPEPGIKPASPELQVHSFTAEPPGKPISWVLLLYSFYIKRNRLEILSKFYKM